MRRTLASVIVSNRGAILFVGVVLNLLAIDSYAQTSISLPDSSNVIVIKKEWRFQVRNPALDESPFLDMDERFQLEQNMRETVQENQRRAKLGLKPVKMRPRPGVEKKDGYAAASYVYEVKLRNAGEKAISALILEYIFFEPDTETEISRRLFLSKRHIAPGKSKTLVFRTGVPPTGTINARYAGKKSGEQYSEQVVIQSIKYADGSAWQASRKP
jgi:hypothetical protein